MSILADGQVSTTKTTIFEVGDSAVLDTEIAVVEKITLFNTSAVEQTAAIFVKTAFGVSRQLRQFILLENEGGEYLEPGESLPLEMGDEIEAQTTSAGAVDFVIFGTRE